MSILDTTIVNVAIETLSVDLKSPISSVQWVVTGYMLALAAVIPVTGWAARRLGTRRLYLISLVLFTLGSLLCGFAWSTELVDRVPRPSGPRRRHADADRDDHPGARGRPAPDGSHPQHRRRADGARTGIRPGHRRPARRAFRLALDLLHQHPGRDHRRCSRVEAAPGRKGRGGRQARRAGARPARDRIARAHLRPRQGRQRRRLRVGAGARADRDRAAVDRRLRRSTRCGRRTRCSTSGSTPTAPSRLPRPRRSSSAHRSSAP